MNVTFQLLKSFVTGFGHAFAQHFTTLRPEVTMSET